MKVHINIDEKHEETSVTIHAKVWSKELESLVTTIKNTGSKRIIGKDQEQSILLNPNDIDFVYAEKRKVFAAIGKQTTELKMKLYEVESLLTPHQFSRFSKSVIGNLNHVQRFELSFNGNLCVHFKSGSKEYVSRKYASSLKEKLIMGGDPNGI